MSLTVIGPTHPFRGGIAHYTTLLVRNLRVSHEVQFFSYSRQYPHWLYPGNTDLDPSHSLLTYEAPSVKFDALNPLAWIRLAREVRASNSRLVILQWSTVYWTPFYWLFLRSLGKRSQPKCVFICHNVMEHEPNRIKSALSRRVLNCADFFITHSQWDRENLERWLGPSRATAIRVCPHPAYEHLSQPVLSKAEAKAGLGIHAERVVLFFGFIRDYKGLRYLIESLPQVRAKLDVHLLIAGEVWGDAKPYHELISQLGISASVTFVEGYIPNEAVARYFASSDLVVIPYVSATQSGIVQLAYGFGKPVVVSRVGGLPEVVEEGVTGYLVPPQDSASISNAVLDFYQQNREAGMSEAVRLKRAAFSWKRLCQTIEDLGKVHRNMTPPQRFLDRFDYLRDEYAASRKAKSGKIVRILQRELRNPKGAVIADIGCSEGRITESLSKEFGLVVGLDIDYPLTWTGEFPFVQADGSLLPLATDRFDGVVINHILEHAASPTRLLDEVWRVLKPGGICYLGVPNRYWPMEPHYRLLLLSWLPRSLACRYVRLAGKGTSYPEQLPSYWSIRRLSRRFTIKDLTAELLKTPELFFPDDPALLGQARKLKWLPKWMLKILIPAVPSWVLILRKG